MYSLSKKSQERLLECHPDLQLLMNELIKELDVTILCGQRGEKEQTDAFNGGFSKVQFPNSKHNKSPSLAVDVAPYPIDWNNIDRFNDMCDRIERIAKDKQIEIRLGRDFKFRDYPHIELK